MGTVTALSIPCADKRHAYMSPGTGLLVSTICLAVWIIKWFEQKPLQGLVIEAGNIVQITLPPGLVLVI
jgi:hypothetical protein